MDPIKLLALQAILGEGGHTPPPPWGQPSHTHPPPWGAHWNRRRPPYYKPARGRPLPPRRSFPHGHADPGVTPPQGTPPSRQESPREEGEIEVQCALCGEKGHRMAACSRFPEHIAAISRCLGRSACVACGGDHTMRQCYYIKNL